MKDALAGLFGLLPGTRPPTSAGPISKTRYVAGDADRNGEAAWLSLLRHELKTPLAGLLGLASRLEQSALDPAQRMTVEALAASGRQLAGMIDRLAAGPGFVPPAGDRPDFDGHRFLDALVLAHWPQASGRHIGLHLVVDPATPRRWCTDAAKLRQILDNLLANAIEATRQGYVQVRVRPASRPIAGRFAVELTVEDTGTGLDPSLRRHLYRWGVRGSTAAARRPGGSGIGLFVCRWLSAELGGRIAHRSRSGAGSEFTLSVPVAPGARPLAAVNIRPAALAGIRCAVSLQDPAAGAAIAMLGRIGIRACRAPRADWERCSRRRDMVLCEPEAIDARQVLAVGGSDRPAALAVIRGRESGQGNGGRLLAVGLPAPLLRGSSESLLFDLAMAMRAAPQSAATGSLSARPDSAPRRPE